MSISPVNSNSLIAPASTSYVQQRQQDFAALQSTIQAGDIAGAQKALAAFQKDLQANPGGSKNPSQDLQNIQSALSGGDVSGAQKALASFIQDMQQAKSHHHHKHHTAVDQSTTTTDNTSTDNSSPATGINVTV